VRIDEEMVTKMMIKTITEDITNKYSSLNQAITDNYNQALQYTVSKLVTIVDKEKQEDVCHCVGHFC
jgi:hypothetical protein